MSLLASHVNVEQILKLMLDKFIDMLYLPIETQGETKALVILVNNESVIARITILFDSKQGKILTRVMNLTKATKQGIKKLSIEAIRKSGLFNHIN